ncbi:uncharacterized protein PRCAT00003549001 [Priceomyces carsonii]|uniref:uncharacterized protein n=1 Tax=Priceomyces carsonii TaxID=28549 RepID=UPI002EDB1F6B|nr:unnamed protein product [Priceomyces carsonii]
MVQQDNFAVEQFMDQYEHSIKFNMGETCCNSLSVNEVIDLASENGANGSQLKRGIIDSLFSKRLTYGNISGSEDLKHEIARLYNTNNDGSLLIGPKNIVITNGAIGANFLTFYTIVDRNDHIIVVDPSYQQLSSVPGVFTSKRTDVDLLRLNFEDDYLPNLDNLRLLVKPGKTKLVVINNPNNPTGAVWGDDVMKEVVSICEEHDIYLLCDEVYRPLFHSVTMPPSSVINFGYEKCILTSSMSKAFSLAGLRLGWIVSRDKSFIEGAMAKRDYNTISISVVDDELATFALKNHDTILKRNYELCRNNLKLLENFIDSSKGLIEWVKPRGGSTAFVKVTIPGINTYEMCCELADDYQCLVVPGEVFGKDKSGFLRIGFGNSQDDLKGGLSVLKKYLQDKEFWP